MAWTTSDIGAYKAAAPVFTSEGTLVSAIASTTGTGTVVSGTSTLNNKRISSMHFQRHYEPIAIGAPV